jgi:hypothetical protein
MKEENNKKNISYAMGAVPHIYFQRALKINNGNPCHDNAIWHSDKIISETYGRAKCQ